MLILTAALVGDAFAGNTPAGANMLEEAPRYGVYYHSYEPAFYTGFAPRATDPSHIQIHIGRGNQMRVTLVLTDDLLRDYADDLLARDRAYSALIGSGRMVLTQNRAFADFHKAIEDAGVAKMVLEEASMPDDARRGRNLALLERLNPHRVFRIRIATSDLYGQWQANLRPEDASSMSTARQLELVNLMLPTRLFVDGLDARTSADLAALVRKSLPNADASLAFVELLGRLTRGMYPVRGGNLEFAELTAIYPVGTWNQSTTLNGRSIPEYPTPGRRALTTHQRTLTIDHVPEDETYSYFPWLPYMHVGTRLHNAIHTLFWKMKPAETAFLPASWREAKDPSGAGYEYLWLLSRGPMSHGCTHLNAGHISELRQMLPARPEDLAKVDVFYNTSFLYDVFDIDGDLHPEVMGVRYFIAYSLADVKPDRLRVRDERHAYYDWLYGGELAFDADDRGTFASARDCRFVSRSALPGREYTRIPLYEAEYEPERIQFYKKLGVDFARALRTVGAHQPASAATELSEADTPDSANGSIARNSR